MLYLRPQLDIVMKILECMKVEVLVEDQTVEWNHDIAAVLPTDGGDVPDFVKVEICDRQRLQDVSSRLSRFVVTSLCHRSSGWSHWRPRTGTSWCCWTPGSTG